MNGNLNEPLVDKTISEAYDSFRKAAQRYQAGRMTENDLNDEFSIILHKGFFDFLSYHQIELKLTEAGWERFADDNRLWKSGYMPISDDGAPWLFHNEFVEVIQPNNKKTYEKEVAILAERILFLRLMDAYEIPMEYFFPYPDSMPHPQMSVSLFSVVGRPFTIHFNCMDDGGLLSDPEPTGKEYILVDDLGLKAKVRITTVLDSENRNPLRDGDFLGTGVIEGYTSSREREIEIVKRKGRIQYLYTVMDRDDDEAFAAFPLWKDYFEHTCKKEALHRETISRLIRRFSC